MPAQQVQHGQGFLRLVVQPSSALNVTGPLVQLLVGAFATLVAIFGMTRHRPTSPDSMKKHPLRKRFLDLILGRPGVRFTEVWRITDVSRTTVRYHLNLMARAGLILQVLVKNAHTYFPNGHSNDVMAHTLMVRAPRAHDIASIIAGHPGVTQQDLTTRLGIHRKVFRRCANMLVQQGLILEVEEGKWRKYHPTDRLKAIFTNGNGHSSNFSSSNGKTPGETDDAAS